VATRHGDARGAQEAESLLEAGDLILGDLGDLRLLEMRPDTAQPGARGADPPGDVDDGVERGAATPETGLDLELDVQLARQQAL